MEIWIYLRRKASSMHIVDKICQLEFIGIKLAARGKSKIADVLCHANCQAKFSVWGERSGLKSLSESKQR